HRADDLLGGGADDVDGALPGGRHPRPVDVQPITLVHERKPSPARATMLGVGGRGVRGVALAVVVLLPAACSSSPRRVVAPATTSTASSLTSTTSTTSTTNTTNSSTTTARPAAASPTPPVPPP